MDQSSDDQVFLQSTIFGTLIWFFFAAAIACSAVRYSKQKDKYGRLLIEDYFHLFALSQLIAQAIATHIVNTLPINPQIREDHYALAAVSVTLVYIFYVTTLYAIKATFLAFYWRMFHVLRTYRVVWWLSVAYTVCSGLAVFLAIFWQCGSISDFGRWDSPACQDVNITTFNYIGPILALNISSDLVIYVIPLVILYKLQMASSKKRRVATIFLLGMITIAIDIMNWVFQLDTAQESMTASNVGQFSQFIEPSVVVIVACSPVLLSASGESRTPSENTRAEGRRTLSIQNRWLRAGRRQQRQRSSFIELSHEQLSIPAASTRPKSSASTSAYEQADVEQQGGYVGS